MLLYITYLFCSPILWIIVIIGSIFNTKIRANYLSFWSQLKHIQSCLKNNKKEIYLFHAASAGEFEQLQPILRLINRNKYYIIVSFTSSTIFSQQKDSKLADHICYHPFDLFWQSYLFFKIINPTKYIITRHDIWPNHIMIASYLQIKVYFINANIHCNSIWNNRYLSTLTNLLFSKFEYILVPSKQIFNKIKNNKIKNLKINIYPDSRIDQILYKYHHNQLSMPQRIDKKLTTIFASIDQFDEEVIFNALEKKYTNGSIDLEKKQEYLIFVPHEPDVHAINRLVRKLHKYQFTFKYIDDINESNQSHVIVINKVGILSDLYNFTSKAYVGGGFSRGVHSILEPAIYNCNIAYGPNIEMLDEAKQLSEAKQALIINNTDEMYAFLDAPFKDRNLFQTIFKTSNSSSNILNKIVQ